MTLCCMLPKPIHIPIIPYFSPLLVVILIRRQRCILIFSPKRFAMIDSINDPLEIMHSDAKIVEMQFM